MRCTENDRGRATVEKSESSANDRLIIDCVTEPDARTKVIFVFGTRAGVDVHLRQNRIRVLDWRTLHALIIVAQSEVQSEFRGRPKIVLPVERVFREIRVSGSAGRVSARKILREGSWRIVCKRCVVREGV